LSGLELHFMRRSSSCIRSSDGTSSRFAAISAAAAAATGRAARLCSCRCSAVEVGVCLVGEKLVKSYCSTFCFYLIKFLRPQTN
jgi:hypothetical protein